MMRKLLTSLSVLFFLTWIPLQVEGKDFIVLLDIAESMFDDYDQLVRTYFPDVIRDHLKKNDVFHLMSFAEKAELEIAQKIDTKADMEVILKRLLLLQPLGKYSDILLAFRSLVQYSKGLPSYLPKTIIILTPGLYRAPKMVSREEAEKEIKSDLHMMKNLGWDVRFVQMSLRNDLDSKKSSILFDFGQLGQQEGMVSYRFRATPDFSNHTLGSPRLVFPEDLGNIGPEFSFSFSVANSSDIAVLLRLKEIQYLGKNILHEHQIISLSPQEKKSVSFPVAFTTPPTNGLQQGTFELVFEDDLRAYPAQAEIRFHYFAGLGSLIIPWIGLAAVLILVIILLFFVFRYATRKKKLILEDKKEYKAAYLLQEQEVSSLLQETHLKMSEAALSADHVFQKKENKATSSHHSKQPLKESSIIQKAGKSTILSEDPDSWGSLEQSKKRAIETFLSNPESKSVDPSTLTTKTFLRKSIPSQTSYNNFLKKKNTVSSSQTTHFSQPIVHVVKAESPPRDFFLQIWTADLCFQNPQVYPNIVTMSPGDRRTVGNGRAAFKIILCPVQDRLAEVFFDGKDLLFDPLIPEFFPFLSQSELCIDKVIEVRLEPEKSLYLRFSFYIPKILEVNHFLRGTEGSLKDNVSSAMKDDK